MTRTRFDKPTLAVVVTVVGVCLLLFSLSLPKLPFIHPKDSYAADFVTSGGLASGDDVRVGGVRVGTVKSVDLDGQKVRVRFNVDSGLRLGKASRATIEVATILGNVFLQIKSEGAGRLDGDHPIPVSRTTVPFTLLDALGLAADKVGKLDQVALRSSLEQLSATAAGVSKPDVDATVQGLAKLTSALGSRQDEIAALLAGAQHITDVLADKSDDIVALLGQSDVFLRMLNARHTTIRQLFIHTRHLAAEVSSLIQTEGAPLTQALMKINKLSSLFARDSKSLRSSIGLIGQFSVNIANATGNGPWLDLYLPTGLIPDNVILACGKNPKPGCGR